jgi:hypothetical protein
MLELKAEPVPAVCAFERRVAAGGWPARAPQA